ncbi:MAG: trigger factor [Proteobacteria bacterium]|nr:trigger factor [Pseudomonadota bacterium]
MQIKETLSQGLKRSFEVTFPSADVETKLTNRLQKIGKNAKIPGFRPGNIPLPILKQRYKNEALSAVLEECVEKGVEKVLKDHDLKPALKPNVDLKSFEDGKELIFNVSLEILPTVGDVKLDNLSFEKYVIKVPSHEVSRVLENFARHSRKTRPLEKLRKTRKGDIVIIDFEGFIDNKPIEGAKEQDHALELGSGAFIPGFEDQLVGHEKGTRLDVNVTFPEDYHEFQYAKKPARFDVLIKDIHEADPIAVDLALAKKLGFESVETMESWAESNLSKNYEAQCFLHVKRHVLDALAERFSFDVPENMTELEFDNIWKQLCKEIGIEEPTTAANANAKNKKASKTFEEATGKSEEELRAEYKAIATRRVRLGILLAEIGRQHKISVTNPELLEGLKARAREFPGQEKEVYDFYRNNESAMATLRAPIYENKVINFILDQSKITEKPITPEELEALLLHDEEEAEKMIASQAKQAKKKTKKKDT